MRGLRRGLTFWRRSIQARVVASTLVLSTVVVGVVGWFQLQQTRDGLLEHRVSAVVAEATDETTEAQARLGAATGTETNSTRQQRDLADQLIQRGDTRGFSVVLGGSVGEQTRLADGGAEYTPGLVLSSVPAPLEDRFSTIVPQTAWTYSAITTRSEDGRTESRPGIVVGSQVRLPADGQTYTVYYLFPLAEEQETLALVTRALLTAAVLLVVLVAGVTWLVAQQVVTPVRLARRVAERLAAGDLQERLTVRGEDDVARLATSFNQMAASLQTQIRQLEELSRVQRRFVSDVSHELRTPLTTVRMAGHVLHDARGDFDATTARAAELLQTELDRFETLLTDLLEISRFDAGAANLDVEDVDLGEVAARVVEGLAALATSRGVTVEVRRPAVPCIAQADVRRVQRIVRNLVSNAIDHAEADASGPGVVLEVASDPDAAAVTVRDYGVGLNPGEAAMVFSRFWRADPARARTSGGTGLGLAIALEDAHLHQGWLQAWGRPSQGASFRLTLPRRLGEELRSSPLPLVPTDAGAPLSAARA